jgi:hypothetical protein
LLTDVDGSKPLHAFVEEYGFYDNRAVRSMEFEDGADDIPTSAHEGQPSPQPDPITSVTYSSSLFDYMCQQEAPPSSSSSSSVLLEDLTRESAILGRYRNFLPHALQEMKQAGVLDSPPTGTSTTTNVSLSHAYDLYIADTMRWDSDVCGCDSRGNTLSRTRRRCNMMSVSWRNRLVPCTLCCFLLMRYFFYLSPVIIFTHCRYCFKL